MFAQRTQAELLFCSTTHFACLRGYHSLWLPFQWHLVCSASLNLHHISTPFARQDSVCPLPLSFALLTASRLLSVPAGTKIFQVPAYACTIIHSARFDDPGFKG
jgi:hypothetical protein